MTERPGASEPSDPAADNNGLHPPCSHHQRPPPPALSAVQNRMLRFCAGWLLKRSLKARILAQAAVQLAGEPMDVARQVRIGFELEFLVVKVMIRLGLLERRLPVLADEHER